MRRPQTQVLVIDDDDLRVGPLRGPGPQHQVADHEVAMTRHRRGRAETLAHGFAESAQLLGQDPVSHQPARLEETLPGQIELRHQQLPVERRRAERAHADRRQELDAANVRNCLGQAEVKCGRAQTTALPPVEDRLWSQVFQEESRPARRASAVRPLAAARRPNPAVSSRPGNATPHPPCRPGRRRQRTARRPRDAAVHSAARKRRRPAVQRKQAGSPRLQALR